jgi:hypothetical protein
MWGMSMETLLRRFALAVGLICGVIGTQGPEFAQQYRQRLAGAVDELTRIVAAFDAEAEAQGVSPDKAIDRLEGNSDPLAQARGRAMAEDKARLAHLQAALAAFSAGPGRRLVAAVVHADGPTAARAWGDFEPAVPTGVEGFVVGGLATALGWLAAHLTLWPARRGAARRRLARA